MKRKLILITLPFLLFALLISCKQNELDTRPKIVVSIPPLTYFVEQIVGDNYQIVSLTPEGALPEHYDPTAYQMVELTESKLLFLIGTLDFEQQTLLQKQPQKIFPTIVNLSDSIDLLLYGGSELSQSADPHIWMSTQNAKIMLRHIASTVAQIDSTHSNDYYTNLQKALAHVDTIDKRIRKQLLPLRHRSFVTMHPALSYYANDFGLRQFSIEKDGKMAGTKHIIRLLDRCRHDSVTTVFSEEGTDNQITERIAQELKAQVYKINPLSTKWSEEMQRIAQYLCHEK